MTAVWSSHSPHAEGLERLRHLEDGAIHVIREVWGQFERPALRLGSGPGSLALLHLAEKAFWPARVPFRLLEEDEPDEGADAVLSAPRDEWGHRSPAGVFAISQASGQRRDVWDLFNGRRRVGERVHIVPLSTWSAVDVLAFLDAEGMTVEPTSARPAASPSVATAAAAR